jgi:hypothetical protein
MLIFVSGHYPILGTQMLYFTDPELKKRSEIAPPIEFIAIENGAVVPQRRADRTANAISSPETLPVPARTAPMSAIERAFLEELANSK